MGLHLSSMRYCSTSSVSSAVTLASTFFTILWTYLSVRPYPRSALFPFSSFVKSIVSSKFSSLVVGFWDVIASWIRSSVVVLKAVFWSSRCLINACLVWSWFSAEFSWLAFNYSIRLAILDWSIASSRESSSCSALSLIKSKSSS